MTPVGLDRAGAAATGEPVATMVPGGGAATSPINDDRLRQGYEYWLLKAAGRPMPCRTDIDPSEIPKLLRDIMLVDVLPGGRYRYRLIGTGNAEAHGINATGRHLDEVLPGPEYSAHVLRLYDECVASRGPLYSESLFLSPGRQIAERHTKVLFLPLGEDGVNMVMVMQVFRYIDWKTRNRHFLEARPYKEILRERLPAGDLSRLCEAAGQSRLHAAIPRPPRTP